jgi:hypothetical protein
VRRQLLIVGWLAVLGLSAVLPLSALFHGIVHIGPRSLVESRMQAAPVIALGSDVTLRRGSRYVVAAVLGNVTVSGTARDDVVALGGRVYLDRGSRVEGDVLSLLGGVYKAPHAVVDGRTGGALYRWKGGQTDSNRNLPRFLFKNIRLGMAAGLALLLIGTCLTIVFPWQVVLISGTLRRSPLKSAATGFLCLLTFMFLVVPLGLSLAGLPFAILLTGAASLAWLFGLTASAVVIGRLVARSPSSLLWSAAAGLVLLALGMTVPLAGPLLVAVIGLAGAGALAVALISRSRPAVSVL